MLAALRRFLKSDQAATTVEFVAIMPVFMLITFFVMEIGVALFWIATAEKAVQIGARLAVVSTPAVTGLPSTNALYSSSVIYGTACRTSATTCAAWGPISCAGNSGGTCNSAGFTKVSGRIQAIFNKASNQYITVTYTSSGLGYAGGPTIPRVTVQISGVPYDLVLTGIMSNFLGDDSPFVTLPTISATFTGEDLSSAAAS